MPPRSLKNAQSGHTGSHFASYKASNYHLSACERHQRVRGLCERPEGQPDLRDLLHLLVKVSPRRSHSVLLDRHPQLVDHHQDLEVEQVPPEICGEIRPYLLN